MMSEYNINVSEYYRLYEQDFKQYIQQIKNRQSQDDS